MDETRHPSARDLLPKVSVDERIVCLGQENFEEALECATESFTGTLSVPGGLLTRWVYGAENRPDSLEKLEKLRIAVRHTMRKYVRSYLWYASSIGYRDRDGKLLGFAMMVPPSMVMQGTIQFTKEQKEQIDEFCKEPHPIKDETKWCLFDNPQIVMFLTVAHRYGKYAKLRGADLDRVVAELHRNTIVQDHWYLHFLAVRPDAQGQGVGSSLLKAALAIAKFDSLPVYLECHHSKVALYKKCMKEMGSMNIVNADELSTEGELTVHALLSS